MRDELSKYNEKLTNELSTTNILEQEDLNKLDRNLSTIKHAMNNAQMFRTDTEARVSVLNDIKHPDSDSKYWQSMRELKVQSNELFYLNFDFKNKIIDKEELEYNLKNKKYENEFEKRRDELELEKAKYELLQIRRTAKDRIREVDMWRNIIDELKPTMKFSLDNVNEHQLLSYGERFINEYITALKMNANTSPSEARNLMGLVTSTINKIKNDGKLDIFLNKVNPETKSFLINNNVVKVKQIK